MKIKNVGIAGSGTMGAGIAIVAARAGFRTIVYDTRPETLERARKQTAGFFAKSVERKKLTPAQVDKIMGDLTGTTRISDMAGCDIVIEAVFENPKVKHEVLGELRPVRRRLPAERGRDAGLPGGGDDAGDGVEDGGVGLVEERGADLGVAVDADRRDHVEAGHDDAPGSDRPGTRRGHRTSFPVRTVAAR